MCLKEGCVFGVKKSQDTCPEDCGGDLVTKSCLTHVTPESSLHRISQARILKLAVISFSRGSSPPENRTRASCTADRFFTDEPPGEVHD